MSFCVSFSKLLAENGEIKNVVPERVMCTMETSVKEIRKMLGNDDTKTDPQQQLPWGEFKEKHQVTLYNKSELAENLMRYLGAWNDGTLSEIEKGQERKFFEEFFRLPHNAEMGFNRMAFTRKEDPTLRGVALLGKDIKKVETLFPDQVVDECKKIKEQEGKVKEAILNKVMGRDKVLLAKHHLTPIKWVSHTTMSGTQSLKMKVPFTNYLRWNEPIFQFFFIQPTIPWRIAHAPTLDEVTIQGHYGGFPLANQFKDISSEIPK